MMTLNFDNIIFYFFEIDIRILNLFHQKGYINKENYLNFIDNYFKFERLGGNIGDVDL
jgi:hypothetical protein